MFPLWLTHPGNPWLGRFFPGLLLGYALKWWLDQVAKDAEAGGEVEAGEEAPSSRGQQRRVAPASAEERCAKAQQRGASGEELKMVLVVNEELKMGKGKIGAQCAHAAVGLVERLAQSGDELVQEWEECGQAKVCLKAPGSQELRALAAAANQAGLPIYMVQDAGRTQVAPGSRTVLAIGPASRTQIDKITGHLKLL